MGWCRRRPLPVSWWLLGGPGAGGGWWVGRLLLPSSAAAAPRRSWTHLLHRAAPPDYSPPLPWKAP